MTAVIMAGGKGTRIRSINNEVPKPMIPVCGKPILEHQIARLKENGITDIILMVGYLGEVIKEYFLDGKQLGVTVSYIEEKEPLGTAGAMYLLKDRVKDDFLLLNGDIIFDIDINLLTNFWMKLRPIRIKFSQKIIIQLRSANQLRESCSFI